MMKFFKEYIINFINGFCMAVADSVPGVSGGTVAFILGFYDKFISSLDDLFRGDLSKKKTAIKYLAKIGIGWIFGLGLAVSLLANLFDSHIYFMSSLFIGFIVFAIPIVIKEESESLKGKYKNILFSIFGGLLVIIITYLNKGMGISVNIDSLNLGTIIYVFFSASLAITAMVLPGISGSTLLLIFGLYIPIITKIKEIITFNFSSLPILIVFGLGVIFGLISFTKLLRNCLSKKRSETIYAIIGMMVASIYSIILGPTTLKIPKEILGLNNFNLWAFLLGAVIIFALEGLKKFINQKNN